ISIDNADLRGLTFSSLRRNISLVSQDVELFNDTVYNNIRYSRRDASQKEILEAAKFANVDEFAQNLENGYDTVIGPGASLLSGGQKQRLSIARAFLKNSPILLLDEATSALDPISENLIKNSLRKLMINKTTLIIAHRLSTIINCDHIFVLRQGNLEEQGSHSDLLKLNGVYKDLYEKQFGCQNDEN
ncbi:MAG: ATP-binding cassette domain-containing protein, partial [Rickettsiales bacterium]|nr:ATP-binding cassette domain-containing protein [Rickettsiales bacterium]